MSGQLKEVRTRIASVNSTQQITKAMKMVSAAKLRKAQDAIIRMRPYAIKMTEILRDLAQAAAKEIPVPFALQRHPNRVLIVTISSDRGLCGAFNGNVVKLARRHIEEKYSEQAARGDVEVMCIGKKSYDIFKRDNFKFHLDFQHLFGDLSFEKSRDASRYIKQAFLEGKFDRVDVIYNSFKNAGTQLLLADQFLPVERPEHKPKVIPDYIFEPDMEQLVEQLVPRMLNTQFYRYLLDSNASEHGARMTAMDKASENANDLLRELRISYNRARQAAITTELTEIVSGAAALQGG